jgi:hypothetical protein
MKPEAFKQHVLGALPAEGFTLTVAKAQALIDALKKLNVKHDAAALKKAYLLAGMLERDPAALVSARATLTSLIDRVNLSHETANSLSAMRFQKF